MKKRGQFFLIAALLISGITIGFGTLYNTSTIERADTQVYDLSEELHSELQQVYDTGTINPSPAETPAEQKTHLKQNLIALTKAYQEQNPDSNIVVYYGDPTNAEAFEKISGEIDTLRTSECTVTVGSPTGENSCHEISRETTPSPTSSDSTAHENEKKIGSQTIGAQSEGQVASQTTTPATKKIQRVQLRLRFNDKKPTGTVRKSLPETVTKEFDIKPGQKFYMVILKKVKNENVVISRT